MTTTTTPQLALTRIFDAPRALVYQAFTDPDHLAAWWGPDVLLAWLAPDHKWIRVERGAIHLVAFIMFFAAFTLAAKASVAAHILGVLMLLAVAACFLVSIIVREPDPKSLSSVANIASVSSER